MNPVVRNPQPGAHPWMPSLPDLPTLLRATTTPNDQSAVVVARPRRALWRWEGVITGRVMPATLTQRDYQLICAGGMRRWRAATTMPNGQVIHHTSVAVRRMIERDLDRLALDGYEKIIAHNVPCNAGRAQLLNALANSGTTDGVVYFAVGTGAGAPNASDTTLFTELFRKAWSNSTISGNQNLFNTLFTTADTGALGTYTECGLYGGSSATSSLNTGALFAHAPYPYIFAAGQQLSNSYSIALN